MKKQFDLHIYISDIKHLLNLEETLKIVPRPAPEIVEIMDENLIVNQSSLTTLKDFMDRYYGLQYDGNVEGIYYGQETCENLIPSLKHLEQAVEYCSQNKYIFTLATPYVGPKGMERLKKLFDYLHSNAPDCEVVVNDFGVLHLLNTQYPNIKVILGRLLIKLKRDPRFSLSGFDIANVGIKNLKKVETNQNEALKGTSLELPVYQKFLRSKGVERLCLDTLSQGMDQKTFKKWGFPVDLMWPWTYITSSRSCSIAAHTQPGKEYHPTDEPCHYQCKKYEFTFRSDKKMLPSFFRGNAVWLNTKSLHKEYFQLGFDRLVYQPYIPV
ncbi:hypothetical protein ES705_19381 [subsurface metagenome]